FGVYYHNCIFHLNLSKEFSDIYSKNKFRNVILCQKDIKGGYLLTQSILSEGNDNPYLQSYYYRDKEELKEGFKKISNRIESTEKTFYLLRSNDDYDMSDTEKMVQQWKQEVRNATKEI
ncbi:MAG: hypothetical protein EBR82_88115, partial [Caulobacteraceae bacterium]|nr:hypothetical protein [Caulobacteraceae bacterium]